ncbi:MAG: hypothetical protein QXQ90_09440 [Desulfurococcaceae archaeon]
MLIRCFYDKSELISSEAVGYNIARAIDMDLDEVDLIAVFNRDDARALEPGYPYWESQVTITR